MPFSAWRLVAAASVVAIAAHAAARPRYGGTLRVEVQAAPLTLDPAAAGSDRRVSGAVFETLTRLDARGVARPALAVSWGSDASFRRWTFRLRRGVRFHDGSALTPAAAAGALAFINASATNDGIAIDLNAPDQAFAAKMAELRYAVVLRGADGTLTGTGPFRVTQFEPGKRVVLTANQEHWEGRPFLDGLVFELGRAPQQQMLDLELGKADVAEAGPAEVRRAADAGMRVWPSAPVELLAIAFARNRPATEDARVREALALSIDRDAIHSVLLQKQGVPAASLLPQWTTGYASLFAAAHDTAKARSLVPLGMAPLELSFDDRDALARPIADRIAVNARDAGIRVLVARQSPNADMRLLRVRITGSGAGAALADVGAAAGVADLIAAVDGNSPQSLYDAERALVDEFRIVPLVHLPESYASKNEVRAWNTPGLTKTGEWRFEDVWIAAGDDR